MRSLGLPRVVLVAAVAVAGLAAGEATAAPGASIAPGRVVVDEPIGQGTEVRLPSVLVGNTGDAAVEMLMDVTPVQDQAEAAPDPAWFRVEPSRFTLGAGEDRLVDVTLRVPRQAEPGGYSTLVRAIQSPVDDASSTAVGASVALAVATVVSFEVEPRAVSFYDGWTAQAQRALPLWIFLAGVVAWFGLGRLRRRIPWELAVRPRTRE